MKIKEKKYKGLIKKRRGFSFPKGLSNYHKFQGKDNYVDGWEQWYNNLDADIMLVGQDYGDSKISNDTANAGSVEPIKDIYIFRTNNNLVKLFKEIGISLEHPLYPTKNAKLFFTNAVVGLKNNGMQGKVEPKWIQTGVKEFLTPLIEIIQPKIIIALGRIPFDAVCAATKSNLAINRSDTFRKIIEDEKNPYKISGNIKLLGVYHCGAQSARNRTWDEQVTDWKKIRKYLN